jgi:hypothetical protein
MSQLKALCELKGVALKALGEAGKGDTEQFGPPNLWEGINPEVANSDAFKYFSQKGVGTLETAQAFREATSMDDLASRLGKLDGDISAGEVNSLPAANREAYLKEAFGVSTLDPQISSLAQQGKLTDPQLERLTEVKGGDTPGIAKALNLNPALDIPGGPPYVPPAPRLPIRTAPDANNGGIDAKALTTALQSLSRGQSGGQGGGQGGGQYGQNGNGYNGYNNQNNPFNQQAQCPSGTQLTIFNGQQACISSQSQQNQARSSS